MIKGPDEAANGATESLMARTNRRAPGIRLLVVATLSCAAALLVGVASGLGATSATPYDVVELNSPEPGEVSSRFGERLTAAGDLTGDGVPDIFTASFEAVAGRDDAGKVFLIDGATREIVYEVTSPDVEEGARFGFYISVVGDVNGDGLDDLAVGTDAEEVDGNVNQGKLYVFDGPTGDLKYGIDNPDPQAEARFGSRIGSAGDVTGDGRADIIVGATSNDVPAGCGNADPIPDDCRKDQGQAYIFDGADGSLVRELNTPEDDLPPTSCSTTGDCGGLGYTPQVLGDLNGDGVPDHMVAAISLRPDPSRHGVIYVFDGANGAILTRIEQPEPDSRAFFGFADVDRFTPGDLNADGVPEIYGLGWLQDGPNGEDQAGRVWIFDGKESLRQEKGVVLYEIEDPELATGRTFGWSVSNTDYNKDGRTDLYIGTSSASDDATYVFDGRDGSLLKTLALPPSEAQARQPGNLGSGLGWSSRAPGDLNGDCEPDFVGGAPFQDVAGIQDQGKVFFFLSSGPSACPPPPPPPVPPAPPAPPVVGTCGVPGAAGYLNPAKLRVSRARVLREGRRLDVLAPITSRAEGKVRVMFQADNRRDTFEVGVTEANTALDEIRIMKSITRGQAELGTGIVNLEYLGDEDTRPEFVRLRAAPGRAGLAVEEISLIGDRLSAQGSVTRRAKGVVRLRYSYVDPDGSPNVHEARAKIQDNGDWKVENDQVPAQLAQCGGYLSIQFTGYFPRRVRGEQLAYQLNPGQIRMP